MDEVQQMCASMLGGGVVADAAAAQARAQMSGDRVGGLVAAARACRERAEPQPDQRPPETHAPEDDRGILAATVAQEMAAATAKLPERQREGLALRELLLLSYAQISTVMDIEPAAVAPLMARARLGLRSEPRGAGLTSGCRDRDRALGILARRQDSEPLTGEDDDWLLAHLASCEECNRAHAAMLEASVCYRAGPAGAPPTASGAVPATTSGAAGPATASASTGSVPEEPVVRVVR